MSETEQCGAAPKGDYRSVDQGSFINLALGRVPGFAMAIIGTFIGVAVAIVFVLTVGGMSGPVTRIANAYAARVEAEAAGIGQSVSALKDVQAAAQRLAARVDQIAAEVAVVQDRMKAEEKSRAPVIIYRRK